MSALTIIYVPGLFDRTRFLLSAQWAALRLWRPLGARVRMFTVGWAGEIAWEERLAALIAMIDARHERGETVALVGASAGASAVLGAFSARSDVVAGAVLICGKIHRPHIIPEPIFDVNDVFEDALDDIAEFVAELDLQERDRVMSLRAAVDGVVFPSDTMIPGAHNVRMRVVGHIPGIAWGLVLHGHMILRFLRGCVARRLPDPEHTD